MVDNIEIRLDQLTDAIKGLYAKSSMSQGEIYNALTSLSQRYENLTSLSSEKIATTIVNEFRKTLDTKYSQTNQYVRDLENALKSFIATYSSQSPAITVEISKLLNEITNLETKLNSQDLAIQKIFGSIEAQKNNNPTLEMAKLSENFLIFSRNFENITITLNKNFADFLEQIRQNSSKEEIKTLQSEIEVISGNVNSVISAISIIDSKYKDLTGLIELVQNKEHIFNDALNEVKNLSGLVLEVNQKINTLDNTAALNSLEQELKTKFAPVLESNIISRIEAKIEDVKTEIQKIALAADATQVKSELFNLSSKLDITSNSLNIANETINNIYSNINTTNDSINKVSSNISVVNDSINNISGNINDVQGNINVVVDCVNNVSSNVSGLSSNLADAKDEMKNVAQALQGLDSEVKNVHHLLNDEILYKSHKNEANYEKYLNSAKEDIKILLSGLARFRTEIDSINKGNIKILQEPIVRAMEEFKNQDLGKEIKDIGDNLRDVTVEIQSSVSNMQTNLNDLNSLSSMQLLDDVAKTMPLISEKLETFKNQVVLENNKNLGEFKSGFTQSIQSFKDALLNAAIKIETDTKAVNNETLDNFKVDLQKLSNQLIDSIETLREKLKIEIAGSKNDYQELSLKQKNNFEQIAAKLSLIESSLESLGLEAVEKMSDNLESTNAKVQDSLSETKSDILEGIISLEKTNKTSLSQFEQKIDKLLKSLAGADFDSISQKKSLIDTLLDIESKIERTNLQQIHNAKELLEEIQANTSNLSVKVESLDDSKNTNSLINSVAKVSEKLQKLEDFNEDLAQEFQVTKEDIEQKLKENVQKISALVDKSRDLSNSQDGKANLDEIFEKFSEYLSNLEYLKSNISQEIKENLSSEFTRIDNSIKKLKSQEDNPSYSYCLEDVESDLAKIRVAIEKNPHNNDDLKLLFEKIIELRTVGLENVKINRDIEGEMGNLSGWLRDTNSKIDDLAQNVEDVQKNALQEIRSQLIQSEKSKHSATDFYNRIENVLKHIVKTTQNVDARITNLEKKLELIIQTQSESFNPSQFIDIFYENMTQTKMLSNRVEIMEDKINSIQSGLERLISYVEQ